MISLNSSSKQVLGARRLTCTVPTSGGDNSQPGRILGRRRVQKRWTYAGGVLRKSLISREMLRWCNSATPKMRPALNYALRSGSNRHEIVRQIKFKNQLCEVLLQHWLYPRICTCDGKKPYSVRILLCIK